MKAELNNLIKAKSKYDVAIGNMESYLSDKLEFDDYSVFHQPSDGFVLEWEANNAPLSKCLLIIKNKGMLSISDYLDERI